MGGNTGSTRPLLMKLERLIYAGAAVSCLSSDWVDFKEIYSLWWWLAGGWLGGGGFAKSRLKLRGANYKRS